MAIKADYHLHSSFSADCETPMEDMIKAGISKGLTHMCFTEHYDYDYPEGHGMSSDYWTINTDSYLYELLKLREKYSDKITVNFGIELGLQPHIARQNSIYAKSYDFDFIIGSSHVCNRTDPYFPEFFEGRSEEEAYREYFSSIIDNIRKFTNFDVYGHLDYVVRYGPNKDKYYTYEKYSDLIDTILTLLIDNGKGIEVNTGSISRGMKEQHPCTAVLRRYKELGGEIITVGSDAHVAANVAEEFDLAAKVLKDCGFNYYTIFEKRTPEFKKL